MFVFVIKPTFFQTAVPLPQIPHSRTTQRATQLAKTSHVKKKSGKTFSVWTDNFAFETFFSEIRKWGIYVGERISLVIAGSFLVTIEVIYFQINRSCHSQQIGLHTKLWRSTLRVDVRNKVDSDQWNRMKKKKKKKTAKSGSWCH